MPLSRYQKTKRIFLAAAVLVFAVGMSGVAWAWFYGGNMAREIIQTKLQAIVSGHLNARLDMGQVEYDYPLGVVVSDVRLVSTVEGEPQITLASFRQLRLQLDKLPMSEGPLSIRHIEVDEPTITLIRDDDGFVAVRKLVRDSHDAQKAKAPKLSDVFHLRHLKLNEARVEYVDRRLKNSVPLVWEHLNLKLDSKPADNDVHTFNFNGAAGDLANVATSGSIDLDRMVISLDQFKLDALITGNQPNSPLPPAIQKIMAQFGVSGSTQLTASGWVPLRDLKNSKIDATFTITDAAAVLPDSKRTISRLGVEVALQLNGSNVWGRVSRLAGLTTYFAASVQPLEFTANLDDRSWNASELRAAIVYRPSIAPESWKTQPATLELVAARRSGPSTDPMEISLDGTKLTLDAMNQQIALNGTVRIDRSAIRVSEAKASGFGGTVVAQGMFDLTSHQSDFKFQIQRVDVAPIQLLLTPSEKDPFAGNITGEGRMEMFEDELSTLVINGGTIHLRDAKLGGGGILAGIAKGLGVGKEDVASEKADAQFALKDSTVNFERFSVRTKSLRIVGRGTLKFDQSLDLNVYAASGGDWGKDVKETGIPVLSKLGGAILSGTQTVINGVSSQVSAMHVTGTIQKPKVLPDPAPMLTDPIKNLFSGDEEK